MRIGFFIAVTFRMARQARCRVVVVHSHGFVCVSRGLAPLVGEMARCSYRTAHLFDLIRQAFDCALAALFLNWIGRLPLDYALPIQAVFQGFET